MTDRIRLTRRQRVRIFDAAHGICHICRQIIAIGQRWEAEHKIPLWAGGTNDESNLAPAHRFPCHEEKSGKENTDRSKADRQRANHLGIPKPGKKLPAGRRSSITKKLNGSVVERKSQSEKHREFMAKRQIVECDHIPMKAALDDSIGCIRCGTWLKGQ